MFPLKNLARKGLSIQVNIAMERMAEDLVDG